jgi:urocanate hydratase
MYFFDYGNAFLLTAKRAGMKFEFIIFMSKTFCFSGAPVGGNDDNHCIRFKYPSYVQDIMGDIFSLGFGPFRLVRNKKNEFIRYFCSRWICASGLVEDLQATDKIAQDVIKKLMSKENSKH